MTFSNKNKKAAGDAVSTLIMFIAVISITTGLVIAFFNYVQSAESSFSSKSELASNKLKTAISISNIYYNSTSNDLNIYIKNIGETKISTGLLDLYINDGYQDGFDVVYASNLSQNITVVMLQETFVVVKNITLGSGTHEVKIDTEYGVGISDSFNI